MENHATVILIALVILHAVLGVVITKALYFAIHQISKYLYDLGLRNFVTVK